MRSYVLSTVCAAVLLLSGCHYKLPTAYYGQHPWQENYMSTVYGTQSKSVTVFPVDGAPVATTTTEVTTTTTAEPAPTVSLDEGSYGNMVDQIFFAHGSARLTSAEKGSLHGVARDIKGNGPVNVTVVGHASARVNTTDDPVRKKMINFDMAQKRANVVTKQLKAGGVDASMIQSISKGDEEANPSPASKAEEGKDRRVDIFMNK